MIANMWGAMYSRFRVKFLLIALTLFSQNSCINWFRDFGDKSSDNSWYYNAKRAFDDLDFDTAISQITPVLESQPRNEDVVYLAAASYAGRAGLRILDLFLTIASDAATKSMFQMFTEAYPRADDDDIADIESALEILEDFEPLAENRSNAMNFFALFLAYSRIGVILNRYAYDEDNALRDNFNACEEVDDFDAVTTGLPYAMLDRVMTSIPRIVDAMRGISGEGAAFDALSAVSFAAEFPLDPYPCVDAVGLHLVSCLAVQTLINTGPPSGLGSGLGAICTP